MFQQQQKRDHGISEGDEKLFAQHTKKTVVRSEEEKKEWETMSSDTCEGNRYTRHTEEKDRNQQDKGRGSGYSNQVFEFHNIYHYRRTLRPAVSRHT